MTVLCRASRATSDLAGTSNGTSWPIYIPVGTQVGDLVVAWATHGSCWGNDQTITVAAGWTSLQGSQMANSDANGNFGGYARLAYRVATSADIGDLVAYNFTIPQSGRWASRTASYYSDSGVPLTLTSALTRDATGEGTSLPSPAINLPGPGRLIASAAIRNFIDVVPPSGYTERNSQEDGIGFSDLLLSVGSSGTPTHTSGNTNTPGWVTTSLAITEPAYRTHQLIL